MRTEAAILLLAVSLSVCACKPASQQWGEEVELSDGRVSVIERQSILESGGDEWVSNRAGVKLKEVRFRFASPDGAGQTIEWRSKQAPNTWPEKPLVLDVEAGQPIVFSRIGTGAACTMYLKYRYEHGAWKEQPLPARFEQRTTNLLIRDGIDMPKFVSLQDKRLANETGSYRPSLRQVGPDREDCH